MKKSLLSEPEYVDKNDMVILILKNNISKNDDTISEKTIQAVEKIFPSLNESQKEILNYLIVQKKATLSDLILHLNISHQMIREYLKKFILNDIVEKDTDKIRDKNAYYKLKK
jgi:ATP-dependent DNA helicase RecG